jgi:VWFA-related protein
LEAENFKLLDNKKPRVLGSVKAVNGMKAQAEPPVEAFLILDAINMPFLARSYQRQSLVDFFNANGRELALPTSLLVLTDRGIEGQNQPTRDGSVLLRVLESSYTGFMQIKRHEGLDGAILREEDSLKALNLFALQQSKRPGRKLVIWLGSGWTVASDTMSYGGPTGMQKIYSSIASMSTALRDAQITLYTLVPVSGVARDYNYLQYVKGVSGPEQVDIGDLLLPVLSMQTGGQVLTGSSDLPDLINRCIADAHVYYRISFTPPLARHYDEYHSIDIIVDKPGLKARTRKGYYLQSSAQGVQSFSEASNGKPAN